MDIAHDVCRFCLVAVDGMNWLSWTKWPTSEPGRLFREVTGKELIVSQELTEWYCGACLDRLRDSSRSLAMFNEAEQFWTRFITQDGENGNLNSVSSDGEDTANGEVIVDQSKCGDRTYECFDCHNPFQTP